MEPDFVNGLDNGRDEPLAYVVPRGDRFTAMYRNAEGTRKSAGTYSTYARAQEIGAEAEAYARGDRRLLDPVVRATTTVEEFAPIFLRHHEVEPNTKRGYRGQLRLHVIPAMGHHRVAEITTRDVRVWLTSLKESGASADHQKRMRDLLSAMMNMAIQLDYRETNPCRDLKTPRRKRAQEIPVMSVPQFTSVHAELPTLAGKAMARLVVASGSRFGEVTAFNVEDLDYDTGDLNVCKAVTEPGSDETPDGSRYLVNDWTKGGYARIVRVDKKSVDEVSRYVAASGLRPGELLFPQRLLIPPTTRQRSSERPSLTPELIADLGAFIGPNGLTYSHGTINGHRTGRCRCEWCRQASSEYTLQRRALRSPTATVERASTPPSTNLTGHCGRHEWGRVWKGAVKRAGIGFGPTAYQLRHTHASWLIESGADPKKVMQRLGHHNLATFSLYVHSVDQASSDDVTDTMSELLAGL